MRRLQVIMPMAGLGSRFADAGFSTPKPLIPVDGMPMFLKAITSLDGITADKTFHFVIRQQHIDEQSLDTLIKGALPDAQVTVLTSMTDGAAETVLAACNTLNPDDALIAMDCDLWFQSQSYDELVQSALREESPIDGGLLTFESDNPRYSYAKFGDDGIVTATAEKTVISEHAITGAYFFSRAADFINSANELIAKPLSETMPEYYMSLTYNSLIESGMRIQAATVDRFASFGTPDELAQYQSSNSA